MRFTNDIEVTELNLPLETKHSLFLTECTKMADGTCRSLVSHVVV